jgi:dienelactone hydrolase
MADRLESFQKTTFTHGGKTRDVYKKGTGPAVIVISEMPGITPGVLEFADRVVDIGCTAVLPHLFGVPGKRMTVPYVLQSMGPACVSKEFATFATGKTSPIIEWLRPLAAQAHSECGGPGVGVVGMCFTGGFALGMMVDDNVLAPVLSQPSMPFPISKSRRRDLGISDADLARVKERCANEDICVLGLRFTGDRSSPPERFQRLKQELGDKFIAVELDSSPGNPHGHPRTAHSVLTLHLDDKPGTPTRQALDQVLNLFTDKLLKPAASG